MPGKEGWTSQTSQMAPKREQCLLPDHVAAGMFFYFVSNPNKRLQDLDSDDSIDRAVPWMVICIEYVTKMSGGYWRYLLLGQLADGPRLVWHEGSLGWIRRVA
jgi:hypothetical protein